MSTYTTHGCGVCWAGFDDHAAWFAHVTEQHGAVLDEFGLDRCANCPGIQHRGLAQSRQPASRRVKLYLLAHYTATDGTRYTEVPLPFDDREVGA